MRRPGILCALRELLFDPSSVPLIAFSKLAKNDQRGGFFYPPEGKRRPFIATPNPQPIAATALAKRGSGKTTRLYPHQKNTNMFGEDKRRGTRILSPVE
jgi:hypothetical protein